MAERMKVIKRLNRRNFLMLSAGSTGAALLVACAPAATPPAPTVAQPTAVKPAAQVPSAPPSQATAVASATPTQAPVATAVKPAEPKRGGTFTLARTATISEFNPFNLTVGHYGFIRVAFNTLARYDAKLNLQPDLAEKWDLSADGKTVSLKLREGVKFHSGREFTAEDVKASLEFGQTNEKALLRESFRMVKQAEVTGKYTIALRFDNVYPGLYDLLDALWIIDKESIESRANAVNGTGPFKLDKYVPKDRAEFVAFKDYWDKGKPYLDRYVLREIPDLPSLAINLESGSVDAIYKPNVSDVIRLSGQTAKFYVAAGKSGSIFDVGMNCKMEPFTDKRVRQAVAWSIDRARFCKTILQGLSEPTCLMWPPHSWAYFKELEGKIGYDLEKAKALLKDAGLANGFETELVTASALGTGRRELAEILQADLAKIGVKTKLADIEGATFTTRTQTKRDVPLMTHEYGRAGRDPGTTIGGAKAWYTEAQGGWTRFESAQYDQLVKDLQSTLDRDKRAATARKIQELTLDECFTVSVAVSPTVHVVASPVKGFDDDMDQAIIPAGIWLDK
jgi:peptide/nickel transport system substrate-binding protein